MTAHATEVSRGDRFEFGANWARFQWLIEEASVLDRDYLTRLG